MLRPLSLVLAGLLLGWASRSAAQDAPVLPAPRDPSTTEPETLPPPSEPATLDGDAGEDDAGGDEDGEEADGDDELDDSDDERRVPIVPVPPAPSDAEDEEEDDPIGEGEPIDEGFELPPIPDEPPIFRLRAGAGVWLPTGGPTSAGARFTQDFEVHMRELAPFYFGLGGAETLTAGNVIGQTGLNAGLSAWIAEDPLYRLQGAIHFHIGAVFGGGYADVDLGGEVDIRMLVADDYLELHVRGGFFTFGGVSSINISGGLGVAF